MMLQLSDKEKEMLKEISENDELAECFASNHKKRCAELLC